jgi:hypothetical protein
MISLAYALRTLRSPIVLTALFFLVITKADQSREVLLILIDEPLTNWMALVSSLVLTIAFSLLLYAVARDLISIDPPPAGISTGPAAFVAVFCTVAPFATLGYAMTLSKNAPSFIRLAFWFAMAASLALGFAVRGIFKSLESAPSEPERPPEPFILGRTTLATSLILFGSVTLSVIIFPLITGAILGPLGVLALFCGILLVLLGCLKQIWLDDHWPVFSTLVILAALWSYFGLNGKHPVKLLGEPSAPALPFDTAFAQWFAARQDLDAFDAEARPYPVYVIAAEGGGAYAGYHAASVLARIQDSCPSFAQHVFAISGVSGGSVGASVFAASANLYARNQREIQCAEIVSTSGQYQSIADAFFDHDFLTPVLAGLLFPDFLQLFLPFAVPPLDRVHAFERSLETAWSRIPSKPLLEFNTSFRKLWSPEGATPALLLNTTEASIGISEIIAPFVIQSWLMPQTQAFLGAVNDLPLSTAAGLSSRFPWLTPAGTFKAYDAEFQGADGGYFENSGVDTVHNIVRELRRKQPSLPATQVESSSRLEPQDPNRLHLVVKGRTRVASFKLIIIHAEAIPSFTTPAGEIFAPIHAMLSAREQRAAAARRAALMSMCPACLTTSFRITDSVRYQTLTLKNTGVPLGWWLSRGSRAHIRGDVGNNTSCPLRAALPSTTPDRGIIRVENDCLYEFIRRDLGG